MNMKYLLKSGTVLLTSLFLAASPLSHAGNRSCKAASGSIREEIAANPELAAGLFNPYPDHNIGIISDAPKGYRPFYISHYGRHGSRWLANDREYSNVTKPLERAAKAGKLTDKGRKLLERVCSPANRHAASKDVSPLWEPFNTGASPKEYSPTIPMFSPTTLKSTRDQQ